MRTLSVILLFASSFLYCACTNTVSFIVVSDPHFTGDRISDSINRLMVEDMNSLNGITTPDGKIALHPDFVWMLGDMTDNAETAQWLQYEEMYGLNGEKLLHYPVMECFGNHDGNIDGIVRKQLKERNPNRKIKISTDSLGLHYSWDINNIHFVNLNLYPGNEWDPNCEWCKYFKESFREPQYSLNFLEKDLKEKVGKSGRPVILAFHIGFDDFSTLWWTDRDRENFYRIVKD